MSTHKATAAFVASSLGAGFSTRAMFGEYALYCQDRVVALICDDQLFVKDLPASASLAAWCETGVPYPGARQAFIVPEGRVGEVVAVLRAVAADLPPPKKRKK